MIQKTLENTERAPQRLSWKAIGIIGVHAFVGWMLCTASMAISMATTTVENALIIHAIGAPIFYTIISLIYFNRFNYTSPLRTAVIFVAFVILMDFFVVSLMVLGSFDMFFSLLGTWIPFTLIFASTYLTGVYTLKNKKDKNVRSAI
ncbi:MAG: hypothetical protein JSV68_12265 [Anaerolineaceae bacterium]|nr:MAG: hypothetical protein JSV68_12265 [Anaerolineaceae bacterium]